MYNLDFDGYTKNLLTFRASFATKEGMEHKIFCCENTSKDIEKLFWLVAQHFIKKT